MKNKFILFTLLFLNLAINAQIGINTQNPKSTLDINGSFASKVSVVAANTTLDMQHSVVICNAPTPININLPTATSISGRIYIIKNVTNNAVSIVAKNAQTIDGNTNVTINNINTVFQVISDGNNWFIIDKYIP